MAVIVGNMLIVRVLVGVIVLLLDREEAVASNNKLLLINQIMAQ